eukprot:TRINITY_DN6139_c0_g1_i3.p1 TRINITY_DN6139_c0_g1~~TRINITY_DN6139_c0_g1_i3.p1  ORF type:complete len:196 (+),score=41.90 TRINITY_DN6139_c0_g1_i3:110-697(+)
MQENEKFCLELENIHKRVRIHTKPTKIQEELAKMRAAKKKSSPSPKKRVTFPQPAHTQGPPQASLPESPQQPEPQSTQAVEEVDPGATQTAEQGATQSRVYDRTLYHCHKSKNTFHSVFPAYGLLGREDAYATEQKDMSRHLNSAEPVDWEHHMKTDAVKRYTEEMLKAANMRGEKKMHGRRKKEAPCYHALRAH